MKRTSLYELERMFSEKNKVSECVENGKITEQTVELLDGDEGELGKDEEKVELLEKEDQFKP